MRWLLVIAFAGVLLSQSWSTRQPRVIRELEPEYTEEARRAGVNADVVIKLVVGEDGAAREIRVVRGAGFGLDENAVRAIEGWHFDPGSKDGKPIASPTRLTVRFRVSSKRREGQTAGLNFSLGAGVIRPELIEGSIPTNPERPEDTHLRVRITVGTDGHPKDLQTLESSDEEWSNHVLWEIAGWRFRPAGRSGVPEEAVGIFELTIHHRDLETQVMPPSLVAISPPVAQAVSLAAPKLVSPPDHAVFDTYPRRLTCRWEASEGANGYLLEWDYRYRDAWNAEFQGIPGTALMAKGTEASFEFVGAQEGRWRVWPVNVYGRRGNPSEWRTFRFVQ